MGVNLAYFKNKSDSSKILFLGQTIEAAYGTISQIVNIVYGNPVSLIYEIEANVPKIDRASVKSSKEKLDDRIKRYLKIASQSISTGTACAFFLPKDIRKELCEDINMSIRILKRQYESAVQRFPDLNPNSDNYIGRDVLENAKMVDIPDEIEGLAKALNSGLSE
jgi:hypothetical protein